MVCIREIAAELQPRFNFGEPQVVPGSAVPGLAGAAVEYAVPPHPIAAPANSAMSSRQSSVFHLRRWIGSPKKSIAAMPTPPPKVKSCSSELWSAAADAADDAKGPSCRGDDHPRESGRLSREVRTRLWQRPR